MTSHLTAAWNFPTRVLTGVGRIAEVATVARAAGVARPLLVTDAGLLASPLVARVADLLRAGGLSPKIFGDVKGNPTEANLEAGIAAFRAGGHDGVVAVGGGSALDVGKCVAFMVAQTRPVWDFEDVGDWWTRAETRGIAPIVAVPTTAGTGSEVGRAAVIGRADTHEKKIIFHPAMLPRVAIADPELAVGLPPFLTMATGMDALAHCFEAYCVDAFHPMADGVALEGMRIVATWLPRAVADGGDLEARAWMFAAASMGATAFQKGLGAVHAVSHPVGARFDTHHGLTNGVLLPYVMRCNRAQIEPKMALLARVLDLPAGGFDGVLDWVLRLRAELGVPPTLADIGVPASAADAIAADAVRDPTAAGNPRRLDVEGFAGLVRAAIGGQ